jgi:hypothetical protein
VDTRPHLYCDPLCKTCYLTCTYLLTYLTPWSRVLEKLTSSHLVKEFPRFYEPEGSLLHSQVPCTWSYPEPDQSSPCPSHILKIHFNIILPSTPGSSKWFLSLRFPRKNPVYISPLLSPICAVPKTLAQVLNIAAPFCTCCVCSPSGGR